MFKFHFNKVYKYVKSKPVIEIFFDAVAMGLGTLAVTGIAFMIFAILTGEAANANFNCGICY